MPKPLAPKAEAAKLKLERLIVRLEPTHKRPPSPAPAAKAPAKEPAKAAASAGGDPRPLRTVQVEGLEFKTYQCDGCSVTVFVGQHVCFGCGARLKNVTNFTSSKLRFLAVARKNVLRDICRSNRVSFTGLTANDIRASKDVSGKLPKSPEAAMLEKACNHLERALEKGHLSIIERYQNDAVFAANMLADGQTQSNLKIWDCLAHGITPASQRSSAQRALNLGASQQPMAETAAFPARTVFFYGISGETLRAANLIGHVDDPPVCIGFAGTFFNVKNFAELLFNQPNVTDTLLAFAGHWSLPRVGSIDSYTAYLNDWFRGNQQQMMAAYKEQRAIAEYNRQRQKGQKGKAGAKGGGKGGYKKGKR